MPEIDVKAIQERERAAHAEVVRLCEAGREWRMSIPANSSRDSDLIIDASLRDIPTLLARLAEAEEMLERTEQQVHEPGGFIETQVDLEQTLSDAQARLAAVQTVIDAANVRLADERWVLVREVEAALRLPSDGHAQRAQAILSSDQRCTNCRVSLHAYCTNGTCRCSCKKEGRIG